MSAPSKLQTPSLVELEGWARDSSGESWQSLLKALTDLYLIDVEEHSDEHGNAYSEIVCRILDDAEADVRVELSERVAPLKVFPSSVVLRLATDEESSVASPVLEHSPALTEKDLAEIVTRMLPVQSLAISRRKKLGAGLTDLLIKQGDDAVMLSIAGNHGAKMSEKTYRTVVEKAKNDPALQEQLIERDDMSQAIAVQIAPFLSDELKARFQAFDDSEGGSLLDSLSEFLEETKPKKKK